MFQKLKKLGIKIGGGYKYPQGMNDIDYHAHSFMENGFGFIFFKIK